MEELIKSEVFVKGNITTRISGIVNYKGSMVDGQIDKELMFVKDKRSQG